METIHEKIMKEKRMLPEDASALILKTQRILKRSAEGSKETLQKWLGVSEIFLKDVMEFSSDRELPSPKEKELALKAPEENVLSVNGVTLSPDQCQAYEIMQKMPKGGMVFITGRAGTGKSTVMDCFCQGRNDVVRLASTGVAAQNVNGRTLDSFLGLIPNNTWTIDPFKLIKRLAFKEYVIIDEISMVGLEKFEFAVENIFKASKNVKLIFMGDFAQLEPINDHPCFRSSYWPNVHAVELTHIHRQTDPTFITALNALREGHSMDPVYQQVYKERLVDKVPEDCILIAPRRATQEEVNKQRLAALDAEVHTNEAVVELGTWKNNRIPQQVHYAVGCRVLMLSNEKDGKWVNGSLGTVTSITPYGVRVQIDGRDVEYVHPEVFEMFNGDGKVVLRFVQYPFQLGYAITIHKSQGLTLDKVAIDMVGHFGKNMSMTYVAWSRCRSREGMFLTHNALGDFNG